MNNSTYIYLTILIVIGLIYLTRLFIMLLHKELHWYERIGIVTLMVFYRVKWIEISVNVGEEGR